MTDSLRPTFRVPGYARAERLTRLTFTRVAADGNRQRPIPMSMRVSGRPPPPSVGPDRNSLAESPGNPNNDTRNPCVCGRDGHHRSSRSPQPPEADRWPLAVTEQGSAPGASR